MPDKDIVEINDTRGHFVITNRKKFLRIIWWAIGDMEDHKSMLSPDNAALLAEARRIHEKMSK